MSNVARSYALWPAGLWLVLALCGVCVNKIADQPVIGWWLVIYSWLTLVASAVAIMMFWIDNRAARRKKRRISERTLHTVAAVGGWPGAVVGQQWFRHKSQKVPFRFALWLIVIAHVALACAIGWWQTR